VFERIITSNLDNYDYFVIIPHFLPGSKSPAEIIKRIPRDRVLIIDKKINELLDKYPIVYQDFETDIFDALNMGYTHLSKYKQLNLLFPDNQFYSREIRTGFIYFCQSKGIPYRVFDELTCADLEPGNAYVIINDDDLVTFIKYARERGFQLGKAVGVISYNENPMKEILEDGITTISTNHEVLGEEAAKMILSREVSKVKIPFRFIARNSL
jgi:DNA-binding LacI/PurR family transcriptional regulator